MNFKSLLLKRDRYSTLVIWVLLFVMLVIIIAIVPGFIKQRNISNVLIQMVPLGLTSLGQMIVIIGGGIDLSLGPQISLLTIIASTLMTDSVASMFFTVVLCLGFGVLFGLLNGSLVYYMSIHPLIVTLCTGYIFQGIAFGLHKTTGGYIPAVFHNGLTASWGLLSIPFMLFIVLICVTGYLLYKTRFGRYVYALGGGEDVLANAGVKTSRIKMSTYAFAGFMAALTGIYLAARLKSGGAHYGTAFTLTSITAVVVGGTALSGGIGRLSGTIAGVIIVSMLNNVLNRISFRYGLQSSYYKAIITGLILIVAMLFYRKRE